ncbi:MAG: SEL1-like repeat protein [Alphaproteobacteria bacterium]|nr:SEL1-like repeat protein [Alphaproteobacteria bacterium]
MKPGIPWSVKGIEPEVREAAKHAARKAGMTLGEWLNTVILDQSDDVATEKQAELPRQEDIFRSPEERQVRRPEDTTVRLEDIAQQLSRLAQRERESAAILPYEAPRARNQDADTLNRIINRIDNNERQTVDAFNAVNDRLSVLGRQIAMSAKPKIFEKPEDVPGFSSLETAIRNVVEHIELSEKRTRDSLRTMQDRLGEMSQRANKAETDDLLRQAPAFVSLESRMSELATRLQRSEQQQHNLPEMVRTELNQLADRIELVRQASETASGKAQAAAVGAAQRELRDIEGRILGLLKEAQTTLGGQSASATDLKNLRADIGTLNKRLDDIGSTAASDRDVHALRVAVEQLSTRVAQGPDLRPLADMDKRLGELTSRLEQSQSAVRNLPQYGELERRVAELDHRLADAMRLQGDGQALNALEEQIGAVSERLSRTEEQLNHLETMERAIHQLYEGLEESRNLASQTAEDAATRAVERVMAAHDTKTSAPSHELQALEDGLRAVRESAANADQRNQETLEAVHETLEQIVNKLAELETSAAGHQFAANMAQQPGASGAAPAASDRLWKTEQPEAGVATERAEAANLSGFFDPAGAFPNVSFGVPPQPVAQPASAPTVPDFSLNAPAVDAEEPMVSHPAPSTPGPDFAAGGTAGMEPGDDFIAAARRAAQAAASRSNVVGADSKPALKAGANSRFKFSLPFLKGEKQQKPITYVGGKPVVEENPKTARNTNKRRKLILAGIVLLAAVSAVTFNMLAKSTKPVKQSSAIEMPVDSLPAAIAPQVAMEPAPVAPSAANHSLDDLDGLLSEVLVTGSLPAGKTDASLSALVAEPGTVVETAEMPPPSVGTAALRQAAANGDAKAQFIVGSRYLDGEGVEQDLPAAARWYQLSAAHGLAPAQYRLATMFERGKGVPQDVATALVWYERAAGGGNVKAMHNAAVIAASNQVGTPNYDKAFRWFKEAAERGLKDSQFNLAVLYERGLGTRIDKSEALLWYTLAARQGDQDAAKRGEQLAASLSADESGAFNARLASWSASPSSDDANVVAITDPSWNSAAMAPKEDIATGEPPNPVMEAQQLLNGLGFNVGDADGKMGVRTQNAIRLFELQSGRKVTGEITPELLEAMRGKSS